jgi:hypothetical protein
VVDRFIHLFIHSASASLDTIELAGRLFWYYLASVDALALILGRKNMYRCIGIDTWKKGKKGKKKERNRIWHAEVEST